MAELPEFKKTEKLDADKQPQPFGSSFRQLGKSSNLVSSIGSEIALRSAVARSEIAGFELGKNPQGDLLPALTKSDEAFHNAYRTQASATLSLQAQQLISSSLATIGKQPKINQQMIDEFDKNVSIGLEEIISLAPTADQAELRNTFGLQLMQTQGKLQSKMIEQQKADALINFNTYNQATTESIFDLSVDGDPESASKILAELEKKNLDMADSGYISKLQALNNFKSARVSYLTGKYYGKAISSGKEVDQFLNDFSQNKPKEMSNSEWVSVGKNMVGLFKQKDKLELKHQSDLTAEFDLRLENDQITQEFLNKSEEEMTPNNFSRSLTKLTKKLNKGQSDKSKINMVAANWGNAGILSQMDNKHINQYWADASATMAEENEIDLWTAKTLMAATTDGTQVPAFIDELEAYTKSQNPESVQKALSAFQSMKQMNPSGLSGMTKDSRGLITAIKLGLDGGNDLAISIQAGQKMIVDVDESERKKRSENWKSLSKEMFGANDKKLVSTTLKEIGVKDKDMMLDTLGFSLMYKDMLEANYNLFGNMEAAKKHTKEAIEMRPYGFTAINSKKIDTVGGNFSTPKNEFVSRPLEPYFGIPVGDPSAYLIHEQISEQTLDQIETFNKRNSDKFGFRYEFEDDIPIPTRENYEKAMKERDRLVDKALKTGNSNEIVKQMQDVNKVIRNFEYGDRKILKRIYDDGREERFSLGVYDLVTQDTYDGKPVYNVKLINASGGVENFLGADGFGSKPILYVPNTDKFDQRYIEEIESSEKDGRKYMMKLNKAFRNEKRDKEKFVADAKSGKLNQNQINNERLASDMAKVLNAADKKKKS